MDPITAMLVLQTVSNVAGTFRQNKESKKLANENRDNAVTSMTYEVSDLNEQVRQSEDIAAAQERAERLKAMNQKSTAEAMGRNVAGAGLDRAINEIERMLSDSLNNSLANRQGNRRALKSRKRNTFNRAQSRINSVPAVRQNPLNAVVGGGLQILTHKDSVDRHNQLVGSS